MKDLARTNTQAFDTVFHCVPTDQVRTWQECVNGFPVG
jgi:hypothetical protein